MPKPQPVLSPLQPTALELLLLPNEPDDCMAELMLIIKRRETRIPVIEKLE